MRIAFLGLGRMGALMAGRVLDAGHNTAVWNRTPGRAAELVARGATAAASPRAAAAGADAVVTMLFDAAAVRSVLLDEPDGAASGAPPGALVVDCSTIGPDAARGLAAELHQRGLRFVDAPVAGSTPLAEKGQLGSFLGGSAADVAAARVVVAAWTDAAKVRTSGGTGSGQALKLVLNTSLGMAIAGVGECLRLARDLGLEKDLALDVLAGPFGWTLAQKRPLLEREDYTPATFSLDAMTKDLRLAVEAGEGRMAVGRAVLAEAEAALAAGHEGEDHAALAGHLAFEGEADSY